MNREYTDRGSIAKDFGKAEIQMKLKRTGWVEREIVIGFSSLSLDDPRIS